MLLNGNKVIESRKLIIQYQEFQERTHKSKSLTHMQ